MALLKYFGKGERKIFLYEKKVKAILDERKIPRYERGFLLKLCGVGNPLVEDIDIGDMAAVSRGVNKLIQEKEIYDRSIMLRFIKGLGESI